MSDDREAQYRRAKEVLGGADWLFTSFVEAETRAWMQTAASDHERREQHYHRVHVASEMKALLESVVEAFEAEQRMKDRREKAQERVKERRNARVRRS